MINAVIYARYSSHNQREESIEGQLRKCHEYAKLNGFNVIAEYCDRAITGKTDNRPRFQKMIKDSEKGHFQAVIMYTIDRFARNRYDSATYKAKLKKHGVKLLYTEQPITDAPESIILESVLEGMAEYYSANLSRGVKRGMKENALKGIINGGHIPLGYKKSATGTYEIDSATAPIVKEIFDLYLQGNSQKKIVDYLNDKGYRTASGGQFKIGGVSNILKNKKYIGIYSFDDVVTEDCIPPIIDKNTFEKVGKLLERNKRQPGRMKAPELYLLTGKLFCGHCGKPMTGESGHNRTGRIYNYYKCLTRKKSGNCNKKTERKDDIEKMIVKLTIEYLMQPRMIEAISTILVDIVEREYSNNSRLLSLQEELKTTKKSIDNILRLVEKGIDTDDIGDRLLELNAIKADIQKQIAREEIQMPRPNKEEIQFWLREFLNGDIEDRNYQQNIIDTLINKVFCYDTDNGGKKFVITCNTTINRDFTVTLQDEKMFVFPMTHSTNKNGCIFDTSVFIFYAKKNLYDRQNGLL